MDLIVFDLEGVLVDMTERRKRAEEAKASGGNYWKTFFDPALLPLDKPNGDIIQLFNEIENDPNNMTIILSGRVESLREETIKQLQSFGVDIDNVPIIMRKEKDFRKAPEFKVDEVKKILATNNQIENIIVYDDDAKVLDAMKKEFNNVKTYLCENNSCENY